jgi:phospholipid/cholesterol/gamma-HCH transport system substrate-binding protein
MSRSLSRMQAVVLGLVVLSGVALGGWAVFKIGSRQGLFAETFELRAGFDEAHGIDRGTPVRVRGIDAGQVVAIELPPIDQPNAKVYVRLRLDKKFQGLIPTDSHARLLNEGMLGGRLINVEPGQERAARLQDGDEIAVVESQDLTAVMQQTLQEFRDSTGTLSKLLKSDEAHKELVELAKQTQQMVRRGDETIQQSQETLREIKETFAAVKQDAEAIKRLPLLRGYVQDNVALLYRPDQSCDSRSYAAYDLFEQGRAVLSESGKGHLNNLAPWLEAGKVKGSDVVVVSYADPNTSDLTGPAAQTLTQRQSEAVVAYLRESQKAHRMGWFTSRPITAIGMGTYAPPVLEKTPVVPSRIEILVFCPR